MTALGPLQPMVQRYCIIINRSKLPSRRCVKEQAMGFSGRISTFGTVDHDRISVLFERLWIAMGSPPLESVGSLKYYSWDQEDEVYDRFGPIGPPIKYAKTPSVEAVARMLQKRDRSVFASCIGTTPRSLEICKEVESIGQHIVDRFTPWQLFFKLGPYDYCYNNMSDIEYVGSGNICVSFCGSGSPLDWPAARELIPKLPSVQRLASEVEEIIEAEVQVLASWGG